MEKSLKTPFRSYKSTDDRDWSICCSLLAAELTGFGRKRLRCSIRPLYPIEHGWVSGHVLIYSMFGPVYVTRVEPLNQGVVKASYDYLAVKIVLCRYGDNKRLLEEWVCMRNVSGNACRATVRVRILGSCLEKIGEIIKLLHPYAFLHRSSRW